MLFIAFTKPKQKAIILASILLLVVILSWGVPVIHERLTGATQAAALSQQEEESEDYSSLGEPIRVLEQLTTLFNGGEVALP